MNCINKIAISFQIAIFYLSENPQEVNNFFPSDKLKSIKMIKMRKISSLWADLKIARKKTWVSILNRKISKERWKYWKRAPWEKIFILFLFTNIENDFVDRRRFFLSLQRRLLNKAWEIDVIVKRIFFCRPLRGFCGKFSSYSTLQKLNWSNYGTQKRTHKHAADDIFSFPIFLSSPVPSCTLHVKLKSVSKMFLIFCFSHSYNVEHFIV